MIIDFSNLTKNQFGILFDLKEAFLPQDCSIILPDKRKLSGVIRISVKGEFELSDYGVGAFYVKISTCAYGKGNLPDADLPINYSVQFHVGCADDGEWQGWSKCMTLDQCNALVERIRDEILFDLYILPKADELNLKLRPYGIFGHW